MLIVVGFFGFLGACVLYGGTAQWVNIYGGPTTLSAICFNTLMGVAGGIIGGYTKTRDPFWMMSGALCGIISVASGLDLYYPGVTFVVAFIGGYLGPVFAGIIEKFKIDDAAGAVAVHGMCGVIGVLAAGVFLSGYPTHAEGIPPISLYGQFMGMLVMAALGFVPGYVLSLIFRMMGILRASDGVQLAGMDVEVPIPAYPESMQTNNKFV